MTKSIEVLCRLAPSTNAAAGVGKEGAQTTMIVLTAFIGNGVDGAVLQRSEETDRLLEEGGRLSHFLPFDIVTEIMMTILTDGGADLLLLMLDPQEEREGDENIAAVELDEDLEIALLRILLDLHPWQQM
jgi:hypothetical protein